MLAHIGKSFYIKDIVFGDHNGMMFGGFLVILQVASQVGWKTQLFADTIFAT